MTTTRQPPAICPVCGTEVPPQSVACPECGSDENTGWNDDARIYDGLDLPEEDFNYEEFKKKEFGIGGGLHGTQLLWWIVGICVLIAVLTAWLKP